MNMCHFNLFQQLAFTSAYLKEVYHKLENQTKTGAPYFEAGRALGDTLKDYGTKISEANSASHLGTEVSTVINN